MGTLQYVHDPRPVCNTLAYAISRQNLCKASYTGTSWQRNDAHQSAHVGDSASQSVTIMCSEILSMRVQKLHNTQHTSLLQSYLELFEKSRALML